MTSPPSEVRVVAAVIQRDGRYLVGLRRADKRHGGLWEFPGGKLDPGETLLDAAARELEEELAVRCEGISTVVWTSRDPGSVYVIEFAKARITGDPVALEHERIGWFTPEELGGMPLAPADAAFVADCLGG